MERRKRSLDDLEIPYSSAQPAQISIEQENESLDHHVSNAALLPMIQDSSLLDLFHSSQLVSPSPVPSQPPLATKLLGYLEERFAMAFAAVFNHLQLLLNVHETAKNVLQLLLMDDKARSIVVRHENRDQVIMVAQSSWNNQTLSKAGQDLCRAISSAALPPEIGLGFFLHKSVQISDILAWYYHHLEENRIMYENIQDHHKHVAELDWEKVVTNKESLATYMNAASAMGHKTWVWEANKWMADYCIRFFCQGGAARHYMKIHRQSLTSNKDDKYWKDLSSSLIPELCSKQKRIKLVDVGSCYNPLSKLPTADLFDITAFDLCPGDASVLKGDFLDVELSDASQPVQVYMNGANERCLRSLPSGCYDAVTMSLVLSYLPNPAIREAVVQKAKRLLISPGQVANAPHHTGLLIIVEKQSILQTAERRAKKSSVSGPEKALATVDTWKETICAMGFQLLAYQALPSCDGRKSHAFVFANTADPALLPTDPSFQSNVQNPNRLWIKQDSVSHSNSSLVIPPLLGAKAV